MALLITKHSRNTTHKRNLRSVTYLALVRLIDPTLVLALTTTIYFLSVNRFSHFHPFHYLEKKYIINENRSIYISHHSFFREPKYIHVQSGIKENNPHARHGRRCSEGDGLRGKEPQPGGLRSHFDALHALPLLLDHFEVPKIALDAFCPYSETLCSLTMIIFQGVVFKCFSS